MNKIELLGNKFILLKYRTHEVEVGFGHNIFRKRPEMEKFKKEDLIKIATALLKAAEEIS